MANSGLSAALATVYGQEPIKKIMNGKSYYRAMRAHNLASTALNTSGVCGGREQVCYRGCL